MLIKKLFRTLWQYKAQFISMVLLVGSLGMKDTMDAFLDTFYEKAINYTTRVNLDADNMTQEEARRPWTETGRLPARSRSATRAIRWKSTQLRMTRSVSRTRI